MQNPFLENVENLVSKIFGGRGQKYVKILFGKFRKFGQKFFGGVALNFQKKLGRGQKM